MDEYLDEKEASTDQQFVWIMTKVMIYISCIGSLFTLVDIWNAQ
jgi:hypothetical protein